MTAGIRFVVGAMLAVLFSALFSVDVHAQPAATRVLVLGADAASRREDVRARLEAQGLDATAIDVTFGTTVPTPTLDELLAYQAVFTWASTSGAGYADPVGLGNALAAYVDAGGGVVQAAHGLSAATPLRLDGAWRAGGYEAMTPSAATNSVGVTSLVAVQPAHPILSGVTAVGAATGGVQHNPMLQGCGTELIANWSNGRLLAAARVGPRGGRIVSLNMYPVSSALGVAGGWTGDGAVMMANAIRFVTTFAAAPPAGAPAVAVLGASEVTSIDDVRCKLQDTHLFSRVDAFDVSAGTPTLATLNQYHAVLTFSELSYADSTALGNVLADYVDARHGVVEAMGNFDPVSDLDGRWNSDGYRPFTEGPTIAFVEGSLVPIASGHQILQGVANVHGGQVSYHSPVALASASTLVANWTDGYPFVATGSGPSGGTIVGLNFFPPSSTVRDDLWDATTDGARLMANALLYASNRSPSADAGADQTIEATSPAGVSFSLNGTGSDLDGDPVTFEWSGAATASGASMTLTVPLPTASSQTYTMTLTVSDGRGGVSTDDVLLTVTDTTGPVLSGVPAGAIDLVATSPAGAVLTYGPVTAADAVDGDRPVTCTPASGSTIPVGGTVVTCTSTDTRGNTSSSSFNVTVTEDGDGGGDDPTPGKVYGYGFIREDDTLFEFAFHARESASGFERGELQMSTRSGYCHHHRHGRRSQNRFVSLALDEVTFNGNNSVLFSGTGRWNGRNGYRFSVSASDTLVRRRHFDRVHITITSPTGEVVSEVEGKLHGGNVQFARVRH